MCRATQQGAGVALTSSDAQSARQLRRAVKRDVLEVVNQIAGGASYTIKMPKR